MSSPAVNGDTSSSASLSHITSYPVVHDSISTFQSNSIGQHTIHLADTVYTTIAKPLVPYLEGPYQYVSPYVVQVDSIANSGLDKIDKTFPIVKTPTGELYSVVVDTAFYPVRVAFEGKDYVFKTYDSEYKKVGGDGLVTAGKALVSTGLVVTSDSLSWLSSFLGSAKEEIKSAGTQVGQKATQKKDQAKQAAH
ncbi:MAG: hypothetical protein M1838_003734 [Thelocarpon superellum]|nr:MAG: hypothetical protein M1838_003734 [Thelocarpon superellum]